MRSFDETGGGDAGAVEEGGVLEATGGFDADVEVVGDCARNGEKGRKERRNGGRRKGEEKNRVRDDGRQKGRERTGADEDPPVSPRVADEAVEVGQCTVSGGRKGRKGKKKRVSTPLTYSC
jgi:hypothetical protein